MALLPASQHHLQTSASLAIACSKLSLLHPSNPQDSFTTGIAVLFRPQALPLGKKILHPSILQAPSKRHVSSLPKELGMRQLCYFVLQIHFAKLSLVNGKNYFFGGWNKGLTTRSRRNNIMAMQRKSRLQYFLSRYKWDKIKQLKKKKKEIHVWIRHICDGRKYHKQKLPGGSTAFLLEVSSPSTSKLQLRKWHLLTWNSEGTLGDDYDLIPLIKHPMKATTWTWVLH